MIDKQWVFPEDNHKGDFFRGILKRRGIESDEDIKEFLSPFPRLTYDPFLLKNMEEASNRILEAVDLKEKICIYGDYDADGICSVSLLMEILEKLRADFFYYIPSRFEEGYGLNCEAIDKIGKAGANLIITVDCGISSLSEVEYGKKLGMEIIVTDHHNVGDELPRCLIINPKQENCHYPEKNLSGCGVAFKLAQALQRGRPELLGKKDLSSVLDLVAIATVGDIVPLLGENRTLVKFGMKTLLAEKRLGLKTLLKQIGLKAESLKAEQLAYGVVPHLNAAGRMFLADLAVDLLVVKNEAKAFDLAKKLSEHNADRKNQQNIALIEAMRELEQWDGSQKFLILQLPQAHEGITGIVAGKLKDMYNLPTMVFTPTGDGQLKGTGRSIPGFNLYKALEPHRHMFNRFGGHEGACGLSMNEIHLEALNEKLQKYAGELFLDDANLFSFKLFLEGEPDLENDLWELAHSLEKMEPFGHGNSKPLLAINRVIIESPFYMGEDGKHVRFTAGKANCIMFGGSEIIREYFDRGMPVDLAGHLEINRWNGNEKLQFMIEDVRHSEKG